MKIDEINLKKILQMALFIELLQECNSGAGLKSKYLSVLAFHFIKILYSH